MKLSNHLKEKLLDEMIYNMKDYAYPTNGVPSGDHPSEAFRIRVFNNTIATPLNNVELLTYMESNNAPPGLLLDFGVSAKIPSSALQKVRTEKRNATTNDLESIQISLKLSGTYSEQAKATGIVGFFVVYQVNDSNPQTPRFTDLYQRAICFASDSIAANGGQAAMILSATDLTVGDNVILADLTLNLIEVI